MQPKIHEKVSSRKDSIRNMIVPKHDALEIRILIRTQLSVHNDPWQYFSRARKQTKITARNFSSKSKKTNHFTAELALHTKAYAGSIRRGAKHGAKNATTLVEVVKLQSTKTRSGCSGEAGVHTTATSIINNNCFGHLQVFISSSFVNDRVRQSGLCSTTRTKV